ncbi:cathepsin e [Plakobranchus ocellatus]|uniref:Cathepsin e n=1 Tax=Plakobranchus ocellatus TaxID=259542 RepID=A0AAV3ZQN8_9GAST|nr:cathepsin e [Plakobranchus ocellatus]
MFKDADVNGILGLGFRNKDEDPTIFENMLSQGVMSAPVFSIYMNGDVRSAAAGGIYHGIGMDLSIAKLKLNPSPCLWPYGGLKISRQVLADLDDFERSRDLFFLLITA